MPNDAIPDFGGDYIPPFGGYGLEDVAALRAQTAARYGSSVNDVRGAQFFHPSYRSNNPNPFLLGIDPNTAYETRKRAKRIYAPGMAALTAGNALLGPTLDLQRRAGLGYADLYGEVAPRYLDAYRGADPETSGLLHLLNVDARSLVGRSDNPFEDRMIQEQIRSAGAARGTAFGTGNALNELIALDRARDERRMARGRYAGQIEEAGRIYYTPAMLSLMQQYQNPVQGTSLDDLLSLSLNDTAQRRNQQAARRAGQMALTGQIISSVLGAASKGAAA